MAMFISGICPPESERATPTTVPAQEKSVAKQNDAGILTRTAQKVQDKDVPAHGSTILDWVKGLRVSSDMHHPLFLALLIGSLCYISHGLPYSAHFNGFSFCYSIIILERHHYCDSALDIFAAAIALFCDTSTIEYALSRFYGRRVQSPTRTIALWCLYLLAAVYHTLSLYHDIYRGRSLGDPTHPRIEFLLSRSKDQLLFTVAAWIIHAVYVA